MKKIAILITIVISVITGANAQDKFKDKSPEERAKIQTEWMQKELALDSTVIPMVQGINLKYANKMESLKDSNEGRYAKFQQFKSMSDQKDKELKAVFTPGQYKLYLSKKEELKEYLQQSIPENKEYKNTPK